MKQRSKTIKVPLYFADILVIESDDHKAVSKKYLGGYNLSNDGAFVDRIYNDDGEIDYLVWFRNNPSVKDIAHESLHLVSYIFEDRNIHFDFNNHEAWAYMIGYIYDQLFNFLNKQPK